jgi:hypothetical protein
VDRFAGTLTLDDGERVPVDLDLDDDTLTLRTGGRLIGTWPVKYCRVARSGRGAVLLSIDGEKVVFEPEDMPVFATMAAQRFRASSLADRIGVVRDLPSVDGAGSWTGPDGGEASTRRPWSVPGWLMPATTLVAVAGALALLANWISTDDPPDFAGTTITVPSTLAPPPAFFDQTVDEFTTEWNLTASAFGVPVQIRGVLIPGRFESQLTPYLTMQGRTGPDGTIQSLVLVIDPRGSTADDEIGLSALGVAIAVANPELGRSERAALLADMGLVVRTPNLADLDGEATVGRSSYALSYIPEFAALLFTVNES